MKTIFTGSGGTTLFVIIPLTDDIDRFKEAGPDVSTGVVFPKKNFRKCTAISQAISCLRSYESTTKPNTRQNNGIQAKLKEYIVLLI